MEYFQVTLYYLYAIVVQYFKFLFKKTFVLNGNKQKNLTFIKMYNMHVEKYTDLCTAWWLLQNEYIHATIQLKNWKRASIQEASFVSPPNDENFPSCESY